MLNTPAPCSSFSNFGSGHLAGGEEAVGGGGLLRAGAGVEKGLEKGLPAAERSAPAPNGLVGSGVPLERVREAKGLEVMVGWVKG